MAIPYHKGVIADASGYRLRVRFKLFLLTGNTGGKLMVGICQNNLLVESEYLTFAGSDNVIIDMDDYAKNEWHDIEIYIQPSAFVTSNRVATGGFRLTEAITGANVYLSDIYIDENYGTGPGAPQQTASAAYTLKLQDNGKQIFISTGGVTVPANATVAFVVETKIYIVNNSGSNQTITAGGGVTLRLAGTATTGNRTLAQRGLCHLLKVGTDEWIASGTGVT